MRLLSAYPVILLTLFLWLKLVSGTTTQAPVATTNAGTEAPNVTEPPEPGSTTEASSPPDNTTSCAHHWNHTDSLTVEDLDYFADPNNCTTDTQCEDEFPHSVCDEDKEQCRCDVDEYWKRDNDTDKCVLQQALDGLCVPDLVKCTDPNSECRDDGTNSGMDRCLCKGEYTDFIAVEKEKDSGDYVCAKILTTTNDEECGDCINNEGTCYNLPADDGTFSMEKSECRCPVSRSGVDCVDVHVNVTCKLGDQKMFVCYTPRDNGTDSDIDIHSNGNGKNPNCVGQKMDADTDECEKDSYLLELDLSDPGRFTCGTTRFQSDINTMRYENIISAHDPESHEPWALFKTYCQFSTGAAVSSGAIGVIGINSNDRGDSITPKLEMYAENMFREVIEEGQSLRRGDKLRLVIELMEDGTYGALDVMRCTASSSGAVIDRKANTIALLRDGCPIEGNGVFTNENKFAPVSGNIMTSQTKLFPMIKLSSGNVVFFHCNVKLCLKGSEADCLPSNCTDSDRRKKRAATEEQEIGLALYVDDDGTNSGLLGSANMAPGTFGVIIGLLVFLVLASIVVATVILYRKHGRSNKVEDTVEMTPSSNSRPQRFALPRINRGSQMRI